MSGADTTKGREELRKRLVDHPDPRTGKRLNSEEAHRRSGEIARRNERRQQENR